LKQSLSNFKPSMQEGEKAGEEDYIEEVFEAELEDE
jgi:hypothetical protein